MKFSKTKYLQSHGSIQNKNNLMIQILINYLIFNITSFNQKLKGGRIKDQVGQLIQ